MEDLIIRERETKEKIVNLINGTQLPAFILKPIVKDLYEQLEILEQNQYKEALKVKESKEKEIKVKGENNE